MAAETQVDFQKAFKEQAKWGCIHGIDDVPYRRRRKKTAKRTAKRNTKLRDWQAKEKYLNNTYSQISPQELKPPILRSFSPVTVCNCLLLVLVSRSE